ncbi:hypothetical protein KIH23_04710 [Flavobacterium sp. CYK-55]|uniref:hypothetical protein n=1 Tax=Flavobacterium sp. CYK-55 TaxID=2835529 RepID=UPI001BCABBA5|nr:hypothetical protein [Flavobacterium sp. CYK-55]MBS7786588.1 hypothetical protein [Flavobacterium sp. CYK-55]
MKNHLLLIVFCFFIQNATAQKVVFISLGDTLQKPEYQQFIYLTDSTDTSNIIEVGKVKCTGKIDNVIVLFNAIRTRALQCGANAFKFESFKKTEPETAELVLSLYYNEDDLFDKNAELLPKNKIYIFGHQNLLSNKSQTFKLNDDKYEVKAGTYLVFDRKPEGIKISKGGLTGETMYINPSEEGFCKFLSFSSIDINGAQSYPSNGGVAVNFNTGRINHIEPNLALALLKIYRQIEVAQ